MKKYKAIPDGYMTVGEVAKKMDVSVRTLQYYDKEGLLSPSAESDGGRRLYTDKDLIQLHQILSLKHVGFSLDDIKNRLVSLDTPTDVADVLAEQAAAIRAKIDSLTEVLQELEALKTEVLQIKSVDFKKYADIIVNLQMKNDYYWLIKHFDDQMLNHIRGRFNRESGLAFIKEFTRLQDEAIRLLNEHVPPESEKGQALAKVFWDLILEFTNGDMTLLPKLIEVGRFDGSNQDWQQRQALVNEFIEPALDAYLTALGYRSLQEVMK